MWRPAPFDDVLIEMCHRRVVFCVVRWGREEYIFVAAKDKTLFVSLLSWPGKSTFFWDVELVLQRTTPVWMNSCGSNACFCYHVPWMCFLFLFIHNYFSPQVADFVCFCQWSARDSASEAYSRCTGRAYEWTLKAWEHSCAVQCTDRMVSVTGQASPSVRGKTTWRRDCSVTSPKCFTDNFFWLVSLF